MCDLCGPDASDRAIDHDIDHPFELEAGTDMECSRCHKHLSAHPDKLDYLQRRTVDNILEYGHQVQYVFGDENDGSPPFCYTVGRTLKQRPELLITGPLRYQDAAGILNALVAVDDDTPLASGTDVRLEGAPMAMRLAEADPIKGEMFAATSMFGKDVEVLQVIWPDPEGHWPGDPEFQYDQPVIGV